jgi:hypothetical protein
MFDNFHYLLNSYSARCGMSGEGEGVTASVLDQRMNTHSEERYHYEDHYHGCFVTLDSCPNHPTTCGGGDTLPRTCKDDWDNEKYGALEDPVACHKRSEGTQSTQSFLLLFLFHLLLDYYNWCGIGHKTDNLVKTTHFTEGVEGISETYQGKCIITLTACPAQSGVNNGGHWPYMFIDTWGQEHKNLGSSEAACHSRSKDYDSWCKLENAAKSWFRESKCSVTCSISSDDLLQVTHDTTCGHSTHS